MSVRNGLLALLASNPRHGYELKKELEERTGSLWELNVGQVYTTLSRLERDGLVVEVDGAHPSSGPQDQRQYALTDAGRQVVREWFAGTREHRRTAMSWSRRPRRGLTLAGQHRPRRGDRRPVVSPPRNSSATLKAAAAPDDVALFARAVTAQIEAEFGGSTSAGGTAARPQPAEPWTAEYGQLRGRERPASRSGTTKTTKETVTEGDEPTGDSTGPADDGAPAQEPDRDRDRVATGRHRALFPTALLSGGPTESIWMPAPEMVAPMGPSGKTTLLRIAAGIDWPERHAGRRREHLWVLPASQLAELRRRSIAMPNSAGNFSTRSPWSRMRPCPSSSTAPDPARPPATPWLRSRTSASPSSPGSSSSRRVASSVVARHGRDLSRPVADEPTERFDASPPA